jgi:SanA protein
MKRLMTAIRDRLGRFVRSVKDAAPRLPRLDRKAAVAGALGGVLVLSGSAVVTNAWVDRYARPHMYEDVESVPARKVALVPGCRVFTDGTPSPALADRLTAARELYLAGKVRKILASGDHRAPEYDETNAMRTWLVERGVPSDEIYLDHAGLRTLDTMQRAARVFGVESAVVCTQRFHLPRAVFLARRSGIDAVGVVADRRIYQKRDRDRLREFFAKSVSFVDSYVIGTEPRHLGDPVSLDEPPDATHDRWTPGPVNRRRQP